MRDRSAVVIVEENHVLLIRRERNDEVYYVFPGGGIEIDESPDDAAVREAFEELGVRVELRELMDVIQFNGTQYFFRAEKIAGTIGTGVGEEYADPERGSYKPMFVPLEELNSLPVYPREMAEKVQMMGEN